MTAIPQSMADMTPHWLTEALCDAIGSSRVTSVEVRPLSEGVGFIGEVAKLELGYDRDDAGPSSVIAKIPIGDPGGKALGLGLRLYEREAAFYSEMASQVKIPVPTCYYNSANVETGEFCLLLEDLGSLATIDQRVGATLEQATTVLEAIAPFHARWQANRGDQFDWLPRFNDETIAGMIGGYELARDHLHSEMPELINERLEATAARLATDKLALLDKVDALPVTIVHGDFRLDNMFFDELNVVLFDWQVLTRVTPMYDVVYFLGTNVTPEILTLHHEDLLEAYGDALAGSGGPRFSVDEMMSIAQTIWAPFVLLGSVLIAQLDFSSETGTALVTANYERGLNAADVFRVHDYEI